MTVRLDPETEIPIAPYFFPPEVIGDEDEEEGIESETHVLGRDFFLPFRVTFEQAREQVALTLLA